MDSGTRRNQNRTRQRIMSLRDSLRELAELGSPVDLSVATEESRPCKLEIQQVGGMHESRLFELEDGRIALGEHCRGNAQS